MRKITKVIMLQWKHWSINIANMMFKEIKANYKNLEKLLK